MRIEIIPIIIGALLALAGLLLAADAVLPENAFRTEERRRSQRSERNRPGEFLIAVGMFAMAAALVGRDTWKYSTVIAIIGVVALALGSLLNLGFLKEYLFNRGVSRRGAPDRAISKERAVAVHAISRTPANVARTADEAGTRDPNAPLVAQKRDATARPSQAPAQPPRPGPADRAPDQPASKPKMRDNRKFPRG